MIHILVVEDDAKLNQLVCTYLGDCGFETKGCLNARAAYDELYSSLYDLICTNRKIQKGRCAFLERRTGFFFEVLFDQPG